MSDSASTSSASASFEVHRYDPERDDFRMIRALFSNVCREQGLKHQWIKRNNWQIKEIDVRFRAFFVARATDLETFPDEDFNPEMTSEVDDDPYDACNLSYLACVGVVDASTESATKVVLEKVAMLPLSLLSEDVSNEAYEKSVHEALRACLREAEAFVRDEMGQKCVYHTILKTSVELSSVLKSAGFVLYQSLSPTLDELVRITSGETPEQVFGKHAHDDRKWKSHGPARATARAPAVAPAVAPPAAPPAAPKPETTSATSSSRVDWSVLMDEDDD